MPLPDLYHQNYHMKDENSSRETKIFLKPYHIYAQWNSKEMSHVGFCDDVLDLLSSNRNLVDY